MNALAWITKEAKRLKRLYPNRFKKWTEYVAQASAIYSKKHKGRSPVGHKKSSMAKKTVRRKAAPRRRKVSGSGIATASKSHTDHNRQRTYISIGSVNKDKARARHKLEQLIGQKEVKRFTAKKKAAKRKLGKQITKLKADYRKLL